MPLKIAVLRALKLGDMVCSLPALHALRSIYPHGEISVICHPSQVPLLQRYKDVIDVLIPFAGFPGMPEQPFNPQVSVEFISEMQKKNFDVVFQMQGSGEISNLFVSLLGAKVSYGFYREGHFCPNKETYAVYPDHLSEIKRCLRLLELVNDTKFSSTSSFPLFRSDFQELFNHMGRPARPYICIHPGASTESKRWSKRGFALVGDHLVRMGYDVVFTGSSLESELVREVTSLMQESAFDSASLNLPLGPLAALISESKGLVCNDTGVSHLAALLEVPSVVIFSETDPNRWAPLNQRLHRSLLRPGVEEVVFELDTFLLKKDLELNKLELM